MTRWRRVVETAAIIGAVALCVIVAGPGGGIERLLLPIFGAAADPADRLRILALGIPLVILLVPGLGMWAWGPALRPSGTVLTVVATAVVSVDLAAEARLTAPSWVLLAALWLHAAYQVVTAHAPPRRLRRPPALVLSVLTCAAPWVFQTGRLVADQAAGGLTAARVDVMVVVMFTAAISVLLLLPLVRVRAFAAAGYAAAVAGSIYALVSLRWPTPITAVPQWAAILAVATAVAYVDTIRQLVAAGSPRDAGPRDQPDEGPGEHEPG